MAQRYKIVVFDLDGVLFDAPSSWRYIHSHFGETNEANVRAYFEGEIDDYEFMKRDIAIWKNYKPDMVMSDIADILDEIPLIPGVIETLQELKTIGLTIAVISGGLDLLAHKIGKLAGIEHIYANGLVHDAAGNLGSEGILNVPLRHKEQVMLELLQKLQIPPEECVAIGDSSVDAGMLNASGLGIAFCPMDDAVKAAADVVIDEKDLGNILQHIL